MLQKKKALRTRRAQRITMLMMVVCFVVAAGRVMTGMLPLADPRLASAAVTCTFWRCSVDASSLRLLPPEGEHLGGAIDADTLDRLVDQPQPRLLIAAGALLATLPMAWMFLSLALAFRALGVRRDLPRAVHWLRAAALGALIGVVLKPIADTMRATALSEASTGKQQLYLVFDGGDFLWGMMVAGAAFVAVWALQQSIRSERALAQIV